MLASLRAAASPFTLIALDSVSVQLGSFILGRGGRGERRSVGCDPISILGMCCHGNMALAASSRSLLASSPIVGKGQRARCCVVRGK